MQSWYIYTCYHIAYSPTLMFLKNKIKRVFKIFLCGWFVPENRASPYFFNLWLDLEVMEIWSLAKKALKKKRKISHMSTVTCH